MSAPHEQSAAAHGLGHVMSLRMLVTVWAVLLTLTWLTVYATNFNFGSLNVWIALLIAFVKASLVALYFMHLRYDQPFNAIVLITSLLFVVLFIGLTLIDSEQLLPQVNQFQAQEAQRSSEMAP
jgi:cytochrome c oxidase subunit 4